MSACAAMNTASTRQVAYTKQEHPHADSSPRYHHFLPSLSRSLGRLSIHEPARVQGQKCALGRGL
eukprot:1845178-Alexandrium_andersonii.AAC.1